MYGMGGEVLEFEGLSVEQLEFFFFEFIFQEARGKGKAARCSRVS